MNKFCCENRQCQLQAKRRITLGSYKAGWTLEQWAFYRYQHHLGRTSIAKLLFVNFYNYIFIQQRFRAGRAMNSSPAASPARCLQAYCNTLQHQP